MTNDLDEALVNVLNNIDINKEGKLKINGFDRYIIIEYYWNLILANLLVKEKYGDLFLNLLYNTNRDSNAFPINPPFDKIIIELKAEKNWSYLGFKERVNLKLQEIGVTAPKKYKIYYPVKIEIIESINNFNVDNIFFTIKKFNEISNDFEDINLCRDLDLVTELSSFKYIPNDYLYIEGIINARNLEFALFYANENLKLILGILSLIKTLRRAKKQYGGKIKPIIDLDLFMGFIFIDEKYENIVEYYNVPNEKLKIYPDETSLLIKTIKDYNNADLSVKEVIKKGFLTYHSAMTEDDIGFSFFKFWTVCEIFCLKHKGISENTIMKRILSILDNPSEKTKNKLKSLYELRNELAHECSYYNISQNQRNLMKAFAEETILAILGLISGFPNRKTKKEDLEIFFQKQTLLK